MMQDSRAGGRLNPITLQRTQPRSVYTPYHGLQNSLKDERKPVKCARHEIADSPGLWQSVADHENNPRQWFSADEKAGRGACIRAGMPKGLIPAKKKGACDAVA